MFKKIIAASLLVIASSTAFAGQKSCTPIGGMAMPTFSPQADGTIRITAPLIGSVSAASGTITAQRKTSSGLEMDLNHYFLNNTGGSFHTIDYAELTAVPGKAGNFMIEISYSIEKESTTGTFKGYEGDFKSYGLVDLNNMEGLVRYSGKVCKA
ncbi:MAG: hypothetical protein ACJAYE_000956 [Candidatus Azotimanducaceae bacterium]|jgi:hypothetical protein